MGSTDDFTFIESEGTRGSKPQKLFDDFSNFTSGKTTDLDVQIVTALRAKHPELIVTTVPGSNCNLLQFAAAGFAQAQLDEKAEPVIRWRGFIGPAHRGGSGCTYGLATSSMFCCKFVARPLQKLSCLDLAHLINITNFFTNLTFR